MNKFAQELNIGEQEPHIFDRIDYAKNVDKMSDFETVKTLVAQAYVVDGKSGWYWLKRWKASRNYGQQKKEKERTLATSD